MGAYVCAQSFGYIPFGMVSLCHLPVEGDNKIRYIMYKGNLSSV
jgi:hypothetical protein